MSEVNRHAIRQLLDDVSARTGLDFRDRHVSQLSETIERAVTRADCRSIAAFRRLLQVDAGAFDDFVGELTVGETYFFRDAQQFDQIRRVILPDLWQRRGVHGCPRLWSAGCASGEEAYSLAILQEQANPGGPGRVLATDVSRPALRRAREARYREWSLRGESRCLVEPYLTLQDGLSILDQRIRRRVAFEYLNLAADVYPSLATDTWGIDLILCRNVLIYFDRETIARVCRRLWECLVPGGWLVLGASDPHPGEYADFTVVTTPAGLIFRRPQEDVPAMTPVMDISDRPVVETHTDDVNVPEWSEALRASSVSLSPQVSLPSSPAMSDRLELARQALLAGDHRRAVELTRDAPQTEEAGVIHVRAMTHRDVVEAERLCGQLVVRHRLSEELHYLHAVLLMDLGRYDESAEQLRRLLFLNRTLAIAHFTQGTVFRRLGREEDARRSFRNARQSSERLDPDQKLPLGDGETAERLSQAACRQLELLSDGLS